MSGSVKGAYSLVADEQLDALEARADVALYNAVLDAGELIFRFPERAQSLSTAVTTRDGIVLRYAVAGHPPYKVFWTSNGSRIEAIFPHP